MNQSELRQAITGLKRLSTTLNQPKYCEFLDDAVLALDEERTFTGYSKLANTAFNMLDDVTDVVLRTALSSIAVYGYQYCVDNQKRGQGQADYTRSKDNAETVARQLNGPIACSAALRTIREHLDSEGQSKAHPGGALVEVLARSGKHENP